MVVLMGGAKFDLAPPFFGCCYCSSAPPKTCMQTSLVSLVTVHAFAHSGWSSSAICSIIMTGTEHYRIMYIATMYEWV